MKAGGHQPATRAERGRKPPPPTRADRRATRRRLDELQASYDREPLVDLRADTRPRLHRD